MTTREILDIIYLSVYALVIILTIIAFVIRICRNAKANKKVITESEEMKEKAEELENGQKIIDFVRDSMLKVENFINYTDIEKSEFVKNEVKSMCANLKIDPTKIDVDKIINYFMEVANNINKRGTQSKKTEKIIL